MAQPEYCSESINSTKSEISPFSELGFFFLLIFVFASSSRLFEFMFSGLHIPLVSSLLAALFMLLDGTLKVAFETRIGKLMTLFALWMVLCIPFSSWPGGSYGVLSGTYYKSFLVFIMVVGATTTLARVRAMMITIGLGSLVAMVAANVLQSRVDGRLTLPSGSLANPNDLAQALVVGMCFLSVWGIGKVLFWRALLTCLLLAYLYTIFDTGSRAGILAVLLLGCLLYFYSPPARKIGLLVLFVILAVGMFSISETARMRLATLLADDGTDIDISDASQGIAIASREGRKEALFQSLELTLKHPLFGVGPGAFSSVAVELSHRDGKHAAWVETHNSYTQVSSEMGMPGVVFFGGAIFYCLLGLYRVRTRAVGLSQYVMVRGTVNHLLAGLVGFVFMLLFVSLAYQFYFSLMIGISAAAIRVMERDFA